MSVFNYKHKISYYPVPKCACTSLKLVFFRIENGYDFRNFRVNGKMRYIHSFYASRKFANARDLDGDDHFRFAVVRDPVERLLSCYSNRVLYYRELSARKLSPEATAAGLPPDPSLSEFVENIEQYRNYSASIKHHTDPLLFFLGEDPDFYSRVYTIRSLDELMRQLESLTGIALTLPHEQKGGPRIPKSDLTAQEIAKIEDFYARDYEIYGPLLR